LIGESSLGFQPGTVSILFAATINGVSGALEDV